MRIFEKMNQILKDNERIEVYNEAVIKTYKSMSVRTNKLKEILTQLSFARRKNQKEEREDIINSLFSILTYTESKYEEYLFELYDLCTLLLDNPEMNLTPKNSRQLKFAINTKIELRKEFEIIYRNFKNMAKKFDDIPMKEILKKMREVFGLDGKKEVEYYEDIYKIYSPNYTMQTQAR